jgi:hypothetical protein
VIVPRRSPSPAAGAGGLDLDRRLRRARLLGHRPPPAGFRLRSPQPSGAPEAIAPSLRGLPSVVQRSIDLPTVKEEAILDSMTTYLRFYRNRLATAGANLANHLSSGKKVLNAIQEVITHSTNPAAPGQTLQAFVNAQNFSIANPATLAAVQAGLNARIFSDAGTTFQEVPHLSDHLQPLLSAAWAIHQAYKHGTTVAEQAAGGEDVGRDYTAGGAAPDCLGVALGAPPTLDAITANAGRAPQTNRIDSDSTSRITWNFPDRSSIAVDIPGGGNETYQVSYLPHIHLVADDGTPLTTTGIGVPKASEPAHVLLHWTTYGLTQSLRRLSGNPKLVLPSHLRAIGRYPT